MKVGVIGGGIMGLSVGVELMDLGVDVVVFERASPGSGQSGGLSRVFRHAHADDERTALAVEARAAWRVLEARTSSRLVSDDGVLIYGGDQDSTAERFARTDVAYRRLDPHSAREHCAGFAATDHAILDANGGSIRALRSIQTLAALLGPRIKPVEVFGVAEHPRGCAVAETAEGPLAFDRIVVCAGAHTALLARGHTVDIPERRVLHPKGSFVAKHEGKVPESCLLDRSNEFGEKVYAAPVGRTGRFAIGLSSRDNAVPTVSELTVATTIDALLVRLSDYVRAAFPGLAPRPVAVRACLVTQFPGDDDGFGLWQRGPLLFFAGHNLFKFAPLLGMRISRLVALDEPCDALVRWRPGPI